MTRLRRRLKQGGNAWGRPVADATAGDRGVRLLCDAAGAMLTFDCGNGRVRENAEHGSFGYQATQLILRLVEGRDGPGK
jgi:hypothetical protein